MEVSEWQGVIQSNSGPIIGFMAVCLLITVVGAVVRAITGAFNGGSNDYE